MITLNTSLPPAVFCLSSAEHCRSLTVNYSLNTDWVSHITTDGQSASLSWYQAPHVRLMTRFLLLSDHCGFVDMGRPLWREDGSVVYNCCCLCQRSHSQVRVPRDSWPHFTVSDLRLPKPGGPGPCIYNPQEQGGPVIPTDTGFLNTEWMLPSLHRPLANRTENRFYKG
jgi:hypothetical protein